MLQPWVGLDLLNHILFTISHFRNILKRILSKVLSSKVRTMRKDSNCANKIKYEATLATNKYHKASLIKIEKNIEGN